MTPAARPAVALEAGPTAVVADCRFMRIAGRLLRWALGLSLLLVAGLLAGAGLAVERQPLVVQATVVSYQDIARARELLRRNDPRRALPGITRAVVLSQRDLQLLLNQAGPRFRDARSRVQLQAGLALVEISLPLPEWPGGGWLNLQAVLRETDALPEVQRLRVGRLPVPGRLAELALPRLLATLNLRAQGALARQLVSRVAFRSQQLVLAYAWPDNPRQALTRSVLSEQEQARLQAYADRLNELGRELAPPGAGPVSIARLLPPLFAMAASRSNDADSASRENRAALVALAFMAYGPGLSPLLDPAHLGPRLPPLRIALAGRPDTPQHYLISAALAAERGGPLADAIGLYKEVADSRGGSGFSFNDLAADRAGTRLGLQAVRNPQALQARLAAGVQEGDLLPDVSDLPEALSEAEFKRRYGGVGAPAYLALTREIEARLDRLPLLATVN
jgi:hypothetical protein